MRLSLLLALLALAGCDDAGKAPDDTGTDPDIDIDGDGSPHSADCDDGDPSMYPEAPEICDGADNDCDGDVDEDPTDGGTFYVDADGDGYGDAAVAACEAADGIVGTGGDCDDSDAAWHPGAAETCSDPTDYNCDGSVAYEDADEDGWAACDDCDDGAAGVNPGAQEQCDADDVDEDCDGLADDDDDDAAGGTGAYEDADGDGYGQEGSAVMCDPGEGSAHVAGDCDDDDASVSPAAAEVCDDADVDEDCDGVADDADESVVATDTRFADTDGDGFGDPGSSTVRCDAAAGWVADATDCDDGRGEVNPAVASEDCATPYDDDCDGLLDEEDATGCVTFYADVDGDSFGELDSACWCEENGSYTAITDGDCDDADAGVNPDAEEVCDGTDHDCDGLVDTDDPDLSAGTWYADADGDGYGDATMATAACTRPSGYVADATDCDDTDADANPAGTEVYGDAMDEDCDGSTWPTLACSGYTVPGDYATIGDAIASLSSSTATICVAAATYTESLTFTGSGSLTVIGVSPQDTVVTGGLTVAPRDGAFDLQGMSFGDAVVVEDAAGYTQSISLSHLAITSAGDGLTVSRSHDATIDLVVDGVEIAAGSGSSGIAVDDAFGAASGSFDATFRNLYVHDAHNCFYGDYQELDDVSTTTIESSTFLDCDYGVYMFSSREVATLYVYDTVLYGMTYYGIQDTTDSYGTITGSNNALYDNGRNFYASSFGSGNVLSDPLLDTSYSPPRPSSSSPLRSAGRSSGGTTTDYWGLTRSAAPEIGAVEY